MQSLFSTGVRRAHAVLASNCFYPLAVCSVLSLAFLAARFGFTGSMRYRFLVWNLFLAWVPYLCAVALMWMRVEDTRRERRGYAGPVAQLALAATWLVMFPNAPYILTDLVHLLRGPVFRWWFDVGLICSFALTGCFLGIASLRIVHTIVRDLSGELIGWVVVFWCAILGGFGVYLGRFLRFNSWDLLTEPWHVFRAIAVRIFDPINHSQTYGVTLMFAALLLACYGVFASLRGTQDRPDISMGISVRLRLTTRRVG